MRIVKDGTRIIGNAERRKWNVESGIKGRDAPKVESGEWRVESGVADAEGGSINRHPEHVRSTVVEGSHSIYQSGEWNKGALREKCHPASKVRLEPRANSEQKSPLGFPEKSDRLFVVLAPKDLVP